MKSKAVKILSVVLFKNLNNKVLNMIACTNWKMTNDPVNVLTRDISSSHKGCDHKFASRSISCNSGIS